MTKPAPSPLGPVAPSERIEILDILRGFALIGVLYVNMHNFGWQYVVESPLYDAVDTCRDFVFNRKFFSLFSLLFGIGFAIQMRRARARGASFFRVYWRRLAVLFAIGWVHALIYPGDIVRLYAILGFVLFAFRGLSSRTLIVAATLLFLVDAMRVQMAVEFRAPDPEVALVEARAQEIVRVTGRDLGLLRHRAYATGSVADVMVTNLRYWQRSVGVLRGYGLPALALFLLGFYTVRRRILEDIERHRAFIRRVMWWGLAMNVTIVFTNQFLSQVLVKLPLVAWAVPVLRLLGGFEEAALMLFYASAITLLVQQPRWHRVFHPLAAVGRMALTVYVGQSVVYTTLYYGYGLGLFGRLWPVHILPLAAVIFAAEVVICGWWIKRFRFGPLEWVWRTLTYMKLQPMRRTEGLPSSVSPAPI